MNDTMKYMQCFLILSLVIFPCISKGFKIGLHEENSYLFTRKIVQYIIDRNLKELFQRFGLRVVVFDDNERARTLFRMLLTRVSLSSIVLNLRNEVKNINRITFPAINLVFLENENNLNTAIEHLRDCYLNQPTTPVVMVKLSQVEDNERFNITSIMQTAWNLGITRFLLIYRDTQNRAFSYNPFKKLIINVSNEFSSDLFPPYMHNLYEYTWRVSLFEEWPLINKKKGSQTWVGRDISILVRVARMKNATLRIVEPATNTYLGTLKDITEKRSDFCFVRRFTRDESRNMYLVSTGSFSGLSVIVRKPVYHEQSTLILQVFQKEIWFYLVLSIIVFIVSTKFLLLKNTRNEVLNALFDIWRILLNTPVNNKIRNKYTSKIPLIVWIWSSLILSVSFQCRLIDLMKYPKVDAGIKFLKQLEHSQLPVYTSIDYVKMQGKNGYLRKQMKIVAYKDVLKQLDDPYSDSAIVLPFIIMDGRINPEFLNFIESRQKILLDERLVKSVSFYTFPFFSPFGSTIYISILQLKQFGLLEKLPNNKHDRSNMKKNFSINLKHVLSAFRFLGIGIFFGVFVFILEISVPNSG